MTQSLTAILSSAAIVLIAAGLGDLIGRGDRLQRCSALERFVFAAAIGLGAIAYCVLALGLVGQLRQLPVAAILAAAGVVSSRRIAFFVRSGVSGLAGAFAILRRPIPALFAVGLIVISLFTLVSALAPPNASDWDGLAYHLAMPKLFLQAHRIYSVDFASHSNFPFTMEMLYTVGLAFENVGLARAFNWWTGILCCLGVYLLARRHFGDMGRLAVLVFAGMPIVGWEATTSYVDLGTAMFAVLSAYAILNFVETGERSWLARSAVLVGLAAGTKMTALTLIALFALWVAFEALISTRRIGRAVLLAAGYGALALLVASPWYIKSWIFTGNPVYPFLYSLFDGRGWNAQLAEIYRVSQLHFGIGTHPIELLKIPYALAFRPDLFYDVPSILVSIGIIFIAVIPVAFRFRFADKPAYTRLLVISAAQIAIWCFMTQQSRYLMPALATLSVVAAYAILRLSQASLLRNVLVGLVVLQFLFTLMVHGVVAIQNAPVVLGLESRDDYLSKTLDIYRVVRKSNAVVPRDGRVVLFGDTRGFYLDRPYFWGDASHNALIPYARLGSPADLAHQLRRMGVTHALINFKYLGKAAWEPSQPSALVCGAVDEGYFQLVYGEPGGIVGLYKIRGHFKTCRRDLQIPICRSNRRLETPPTTDVPPRREF